MKIESPYTDEHLDKIIDNDNLVHMTAWIHPDAKIGTGNKIGQYCYLGPNVTIGDNNRLEGHCSIGTPGEHKEHFNHFGEVKIGSNNIIREFTTINSGTFRATSLGDRNIMLRGSHLSHDSIVETDVTISCNVLIGGESYIMKGANLALGCILHQRQVVGSYSMIGMGGIVPKKLDIIPGNIYVGNPAKFLKKNDVGLHRARTTEQQLLEEIKRWTVIRNGST